LQPLLDDRVTIGSGCRIDPSFEVHGRGRVSLGHYVTIGPRVVIDLGHSGRGSVEIGHRSKLKGDIYIRCYNGWCRIGSRVTLGEFSVVYAHGGVSIGDAAGFGPHVTIHASTHMIEEDVPIRLQGEVAQGIHIGDGVVLGAGARVLDGALIGDEAAIGANAVVVGSLDARGIYAGSPATLLRHRGSRGRNKALYPALPPIQGEAE
jgi:acetyltransferase-like isoleucine patch superfamily enzyme